MTVKAKLRMVMKSSRVITSAKAVMGCGHSEKCYKGKYDNRKISFSKTMARQKDKATKRITTNKGILLRTNRSIQVEGALDVIKQDFECRKFLTREKRRLKRNFFWLHSHSIYRNYGTEPFPIV